MECSRKYYLYLQYMKSFLKHYTLQGINNKFIKLFRL